VKEEFSMIIIKNFHEIENLNNISEALKEELKNYFREIAKGIVGEAWQSYKLDDVGSIVVSKLASLTKPPGGWKQNANKQENRKRES
jgi:hypothetical protein